METISFHFSPAISKCRVSSEMSIIYNIEPSSQEVEESNLEEERQSKTSISSANVRLVFISLGRSPILPDDEKIKSQTHSLTP